MDIAIFKIITLCYNTNMDTERGVACRLLVETTRRLSLPDISGQVDHMSREFYPELDLDNKPLLYAAPNFLPVVAAEPHREFVTRGLFTQRSIHHRCENS